MPIMPRNRLVASLLALLLLFWAVPLSAQERAGVATKQQVRSLRGHIRAKWRLLQRSYLDAADSKLAPSSNPPLLYVPRSENEGKVERILRRHGAKASVTKLPENAARIRKHGLLYLPHRYVVPGGRFNEQFGWDSYFIMRGLLRDGHIVRPREMTENLLYEVRNYGTVLNANRTYSLGRSQPPFLTRMILDVYERTRDRAWVGSTLDAVAKYHRYWTSGSMLTETGLSRYADENDGPAPEVEQAGTNEYERIHALFRAMPANQSAQYLDPVSGILTERFYAGDRAMRASGFDTSNRFGVAGADTHEYNPVDLNVLLYQMERDMARLFRIAGRSTEARTWDKRARERRSLVNRFLWNPDRGLYVDYHVPTRSQSAYVFATTFFPLWGGIASRSQAARLVSNLPLLERPGGLTTSTEQTGHQWDAPFGWAPLIMMAAQGLRRYGYDREANRISVNFLSMVLKEYLDTGELFEKYDVERRDSNVSRALRYGYTTNEAGFGWTNAAFVELYGDLPLREQNRVRNLLGEPVPH